MSKVTIPVHARGVRAVYGKKLEPKLAEALSESVRVGITD